MEDPSLYNPARIGEGSGEVGAYRLRVTPTWGYAGDGNEGDFFPVHVVEDGVVRSKEPPPHLESYNAAIGAYDRVSTGGGTYVCSGLMVRQAPKNDKGEQVYTVAEGVARVNGRGISQYTSARLAYATTPDLRTVKTEVHTATGKTQRIQVAHPPIHKINTVEITRKKTVSVLHGSFSGCADMLPDTGVVSIVECRQGDTVYTQGTDFKKTGDAVDWIFRSREPEAGSTYTCTYTYFDTMQPGSPDYDGFTVSGTVADSNIRISYIQALPRRDRLCITEEGKFVWYRGIPSEQYPYPPDIPGDVLSLATILQTWRESNVVTVDADHVMQWHRINAMEERIDFAIREIARTRLEADVTTRENGTRAGVFVDDLRDDTGRDQGIPQTGAIIGGKLQLPISLAVYHLDNPARPVCAPYKPVVEEEQLLRTGAVAVNPYMAFPDLPAQLTLSPAMDHWTIRETQWTSPVTEVFGSGNVSSTTSRDQTVSSVTTRIEHLRPIPVDFVINGFGAGEILTSLTFDGITLAHEPKNIVADASGQARGRFVIPEKIPAGAKTVEVRGKGKSRGSAVFVGSGELTVNTLRTVTTVSWWTEDFDVDPQSETFSLDQGRMVCGLDLWFTAVGGEVRVQLRDSANGLPGKAIYAEAAKMPYDIVTNGTYTRFLFDFPVHVPQGQEYAFVVLCNDAVTSVAEATLGGFDPHVQVKVLSQPYLKGVRSSSSNASTWTAHQDSDLTFRLLVAEFTKTKHEVVLGTAYVADCTDLLLQSVAETPTAATSVEYVLTLPDGTTLTVGAKQHVQFAAPVNGPVTVTAILRGDSHVSPLLWPGAQLFAGTLATTGDYYSRSVPSTSAIKCTLVYDAYTPPGSAATPEVQLDSGAWQRLDAAGTVQQGDGVIEHTLTLPLKNVDTVKARFVLTGSCAARPFVQDIRLLTTK